MYSPNDYESFQLKNCPLVVVVIVEVAVYKFTVNLKESISLQKELF